MAIVQVQKAQGTTTTGTTVTATFASGATSGNLLVGTIGSNDGSYTLPAGFSSAVINYNATEDDSQEIIYRYAAGGETAITVTNFLGNLKHFGTWEYSGIVSSSPLDKTATVGRTVGVTSLNTGSTGTLSQADELAVATLCVRANISAESINSSFTIENLGDGGFSGASATRIVNTTTALDPTFSWTTSGTAWASIATFLAATGGSPITRFYATIIGAGKLIGEFVKEWFKNKNKKLKIKISEAEIYG